MLLSPDALVKNKVHGHWFLIYDINSTVLLIPLVLICSANFVRLSQSSPYEYRGSVDQKTRGKHHQPSSKSMGLVSSFGLNIPIKQQKSRSIIHKATHGKCGKKEHPQSSQFFISYYLDPSLTSLYYLLVTT